MQKHPEPQIFLFQVLSDLESQHAIVSLLYPSRIHQQGYFHTTLVICLETR